MTNDGMHVLMHFFFVGELQPWQGDAVSIFCDEHFSKDIGKSLWLQSCSVKAGHMFCVPIQIATQMDAIFVVK